MVHVRTVSCLSEGIRRRASNRRSSLWAEDLARLEQVAFVGEGTTAIVDGQVLFPERDDLVTQAILFADRRGLSGGREEEFAGVIAELVDEDTKTPLEWRPPSLLR